MGTFQTQIKKSKRGQDIILRAATQKDATALNALVKEVFQTSQYLITTPEEFSSFDEDQQRQRIQKYENEEGNLLLVAQHGEDLIGTLDFQNGKRKRIAHKGSFGMSVHSEWRGQGIGYMLLQGLVDWSKTHPMIEVIQLGVTEGNTAGLALYTKLGFRVTGREEFGVKLEDGSYAADLSMSLVVKGLR